MGEILFALERFKEALHYSSRALELDPDHATALIDVGAALGRLGRKAEAVDYSERSTPRCRELGLTKGEAKAHNNLGLALSDLDRLEEALVHFNEAVRLDPANADYLFEVGYALFDLERYDDALAAYDEALSHDPKHLKATHERGNVFRVREDWPQALVCFEKALALRPDWTDALSSKAGVLLEMGKLAEALEIYNRILTRKDLTPIVHYNRGLVLQGLNRPDEALKAFARYAELVPDDPDPHLSRMSILGKRGEHQAALAAVEDAVKAAPQNAVVAFYHGRVLIRVDRPDDARKEYLRAAELNPKFAPALSQAAILDLMRHDYEAALDLLNRNCANNPDHYFSHHNRAYALAKLGRHREAIKALEDALRRFQEPALSLFDLVGTLANCPDASQRDPKRALELARRGIELYQEDGDAWDALGKAQFRNGGWKETVDAFRRAEQLPRDNEPASGWFVCAMAEWQLGHADDARRCFEKATAWMDENEPADDELQALRREAAGTLG